METDGDMEEEEGEVDIYQEHLSLLEAIENHNCAIVHDLIHNRGMSPNFKVDGMTPICRAAQKGYVDILNILVEAGCNLLTEDTDVWRRQALHIAASKGHIEFTKRLIEFGADVNSRDSDHRTPLHWAATYGNPDMASYLLKVGAAVNIAQCDGFTPLHAATCLGHNSVCRVLIENGADIHRTDRDGWSAFHTAVCYGHKTVVQTLLDAGVSLAKLTNDEENAVHIAASSGKIEVLKLLIEHGARLNDVTMSGNTAFYLSVYYNEFEMAKYLIKLGANMYQPTDKDHKKTPFYLAAVKCDIPLMLLMIEAGYNLSLEDWIHTKDFPQVLLKLPDFCNLVHRIASTPKTLKEHSRMAVRKTLKYDDEFMQRLNQLQLPGCLRDYVSFVALDSH